MLNQLERGIKELVENFIAEGKQCPSTFDIDNEQLPLNAARFEGVSKKKPKLPF